MTNLFKNMKIWVFLLKLKLIYYQILEMCYNHNNKFAFIGDDVLLTNYYLFGSYVSDWFRDWEIDCGKNGWGSWGGKRENIERKILRL